MNSWPMSPPTAVLPGRISTVRVPPIANLRDPDPEFADLQLSRGGKHDRRFAMRFSAGFGSRAAMV